MDIWYLASFFLAVALLKKPHSVYSLDDSNVAESLNCLEIVIGTGRDDFDQYHIEVLGRYSPFSLSETGSWRQLGGRYSITKQFIDNATYLIFYARSQAETPAWYRIGLSVELDTANSSSPFKGTPLFIQRWNMYNYSIDEVVSIKANATTADYLTFQCLDGTTHNILPCTENRVWHGADGITNGSLTAQLGGSPEIFTPNGIIEIRVYLGYQPNYLQYIYVTRGLGAGGTWQIRSSFLPIFSHQVVPISSQLEFMKIIYSVRSTALAPEFIEGPWMRADVNNSGLIKPGRFQCYTNLTDCGDCSPNIDGCYQTQLFDQIFMQCVCKRGYIGMTCEEELTACTMQPGEFLAFNMTSTPPFYHGETTTVWCRQPTEQMQALFGRDKYITTCFNGGWLLEWVCHNNTALVELVLQLIEVKGKLDLYTDVLEAINEALVVPTFSSPNSTKSPLEETLSDVRLILPVLICLVFAPFVLTAVIFLAWKCRQDSPPPRWKKFKVFFKISSKISYVYFFIVLIWGVLSYEMELSTSLPDLPFLVEIYCVVAICCTYLVVVIEMFLSEEWEKLTRSYEKDLSQHLDILKEQIPVMEIVYDCYHTELRLDKNHQEQKAELVTRSFTASFPFCDCIDRTWKSDELVPGTIVDINFEFLLRFRDERTRDHYFEMRHAGYEKLQGMDENIHVYDAFYVPLLSNQRIGYVTTSKRWLKKKFVIFFTLLFLPTWPLKSYLNKHIFKTVNVNIIKDVFWEPNRGKFPQGLCRTMNDAFIVETSV